ncbi:hypothetical protein OPV22_033586 [Ensete ventricosum]|uniref:Uncharacterized protein n=1 Tax=Ensete ventricosum TaxID=4639 RepID=A0AAV8P2D8_ENSVE|nr:hypothetical protein OPV22_033586 [Ensete ventricosum]
MADDGFGKWQLNSLVPRNEEVKDHLLGKEGSSLESLHDDLPQLTLLLALLVHDDRQVHASKFWDQLALGAVVVDTGSMPVTVENKVGVCGLNECYLNVARRTVSYRWTWLFFGWRTASADTVHTNRALKSMSFRDNLNNEKKKIGCEKNKQQRRQSHIFENKREEGRWW